MPRYFSPTEEDYKVKYRRPIILCIETIKEIMERCQKCSYSQEKEEPRRLTQTAKIGFCSKHGRVYFLNYSGLEVYFDSRECQEFKNKKKDMEGGKWSIRTSELFF